MSIEVAIKKSFPNMFRPLKWMHFDSATEYGKGEWFAHGARGTFHIYDVREKFPNDRPFYAKEISDQFDTLEQAQAACQARNEGDIFIGLNPEFIAEIEKLKSATEPFRTVSKDWVDETGWTDVACQNDRIVDWFGPSDFRALASTGGEHHAE